MAAYSMLASKRCTVLSSCGTPLKDSLCTHVSTEEAGEALRLPLAVPGVQTNYNHTSGERSDIGQCLTGLSYR